MKTKNGLHLFPGFLMPTANRKISENFKLIDPLLGGGAPKEENYIEYNGKKFTSWAFNLECSGDASEIEIPLAYPIITSNAKNGFIIVSATLKDSNGNSYTWPIMQFSNMMVSGQSTLNLDTYIQFSYLGSDVSVIQDVTLYVLP